MRRLKIKVVGDEKVGKTRFLAGWYDENCSSYDDTPLFPGQKRNLPAVQDPYFTNMTVDRVSYVLTYWDTICGADFLKFRPLEYEETDVFLVFFDITNPCSFQNVSTVWVPELKHYMPGAPILIVGNKIDLRNSSNASDDMISFSKGCELAVRLGTLYCESSALTGEGVRQVIDTAVRLAIRKPNTPKPKFKFFQWQRKHSKILRHGPNPPILSPPDPVPQVEVLASTFTDEMKKMFRDRGSADIKFLFNSNNYPIEAHQLVLSIGSAFFREYFLNKSENLELSRLLNSSDTCSCLLKDSRQNNRKNCPQGLDFSGSSSPQDLDSGSIVKAHILKRPTRSKLKMCMHFNNCVSRKAFQHVLEYLYFGLPNISSEADESLLSKVTSLSHRLQLLWLGDICANISNGESYLNPSIERKVEEERRKTVKETFINKPHLSDVTFCINNSIVYAHRAILMARSEVMDAMLGGGFSERDSHEVSIKGTTVNSFLSLLDYLYTDCVSSDLTIIQYKDLLVLADRFCLARLITVCEVTIVKKIAKELKTKGLNSAKCAEIIDLLLLAQVHNADQLAQWCLHLIATNFLEFESCDDFELIKGDNRRHVLEHRWPPLAYLKELEDFKRKTGRAHSQCSA